MKRQPMVSIITTSFNQGEFIEQAILSVKNQRYDNIEHIIIDGKSTDNTLTILKKYEGTYNMRWISEPDSGPVEATNKGFREARGEILGQLPTDDLFLPWAISTAVQYLQRYPEVELVYGDLIGMDLDTGLNRLSFFPKVSLQFLRRSGYLPSIATFFRKSVLEKVGLLDEELSAGGDYEYWIRVAKQYKVLKIEEVLALDRIHARSRRVFLQQPIRKESKLVRQKYGMPTGITRHPVRIVDMVRAYAARRLLSIKFAYYYWRGRKGPSEDSASHPWHNLIEFPGFQVTSWIGFLILMLPWTIKRYKRNWFVNNQDEYLNKINYFKE